jgi:hypothetical protein
MGRLIPAAKIQNGMLTEHERSSFYPDGNLDWSVVAKKIRETDPEGRETFVILKEMELMYGQSKRKPE